MHCSCLLVVSEIILLNLPIESSLTSTCQLLQSPRVLLHWLHAQKKLLLQWWNNQPGVALQRKHKMNSPSQSPHHCPPPRRLALWSGTNQSSGAWLDDNDEVSSAAPLSNNYCPVMSWSNEHENKARQRSLAFYCSLDWFVLVAANQTVCFWYAVVVIQWTTLYKGGITLS